MNSLYKFLDYQDSFAIYNLSLAVKYTLFLNQDDDIVEKILELSGMQNVTTKSFIEDCENFNTSNSALKLNTMERAPDDLTDSIITWIYYSIYWSILDGVSSYEKINNRKNTIISRIALEFHYRYLLYVNTYEVQDRFNIKDIEYSANTIVRVIEFLSQAGKQKKTYLTEVYFEEGIDDYLSHCISILIDDYIERDCYFIYRDFHTKEVFLKYENDDEGISFYVLPSRILQVGTVKKDTDPSKSKKNQNQNIKRYLLTGLGHYFKIVNMEPGQGKSKKEFVQVSSTKTEVTQLEMLEKNHNKNVDKKTKPEKRELPALISTDVQTIPDQKKQRFINMVFSAKNTKNNLLLQSAYSSPPPDNMSIFLKHLCSKKFEENLSPNDLFVFIFLMGISTGMVYKEVVELLLKGKTKYYFLDVEKNILKVTLNAKLFGEKYDEFSDSSSKYITFELPEILVFLYSHVKNVVSRLGLDMWEKLILEKKQYMSFMKKKMDTCPTMIHIDIDNLWKLILTYQVNYKNISSLFCVGKYTTQIRPTLSYGTTHKSGQIHSLFVKDFYDQLDLYDCVSSLISMPLCGLQEKIQHDSKAQFSGSNRLVDRGDMKKFFSLLRRELIKENDDVRYFNLYALYARYAMSSLLATRHYDSSCKLDKISYELGYLVIIEKGDNKAGGTRVIPLTKQVELIIKKYKSLAIKMSVPIDNIYFILDGKHRILNNKNRKLVVSLFIENDANPFIIEFVEAVWLNFGRHVLTKVSMEKSFDFTYLQAMLGHFSKGCEQHGIFSVLNEREWHSQSVKLFNHIGGLYGV